MVRKEPSASTLDGWREAARENGQRFIKLRQLLKAFGYRRRSATNVAAITEFLRRHDLYVDILEGMDIDDSVPLTPEPVYRIGDLFEREADLEARFASAIMRRVGLKSVISRQYSPRGTRDKLDFLCVDEDGCAVVVELKARAGDKRAVEQVLRYIGMLKAEGDHKKPRGILITGLADINTRRALEGRQVDDHIRWWVYGLRGSKLQVEEVNVNRSRRPRRPMRRTAMSTANTADDTSRSRAPRKVGRSRVAR